MACFAPPPQKKLLGLTTTSNNSKGRLSINSGIDRKIMKVSLGVLQIHILVEQSTRQVHLYRALNIDRMCFGPIWEFIQGLRFYGLQGTPSQMAVFEY